MTGFARTSSSAAPVDHDVAVREDALRHAVRAAGAPDGGVVVERHGQVVLDEVLACRRRSSRSSSSGRGGSRSSGARGEATARALLAAERRTRDAQVERVPELKLAAHALEGRLRGRGATRSGVVRPQEDGVPCLVRHLLGRQACARGRGGRRGWQMTQESATTTPACPPTAHRARP